jgi:DNA-binding NtrC family response regulator
MPSPGRESPRAKQSNSERRVPIGALREPIVRPPVEDETAWDETAESPQSPKNTEACAMLAIAESATDRLESQGVYVDGSLELLRELTVTPDVDAALPRLSAIVNRMLPHDALRMACFDQRGRLIVNASTADVPDMTPSGMEDVLIDDLQTRAHGASAMARERLVGAGYRSVLGVSTRAPEPLMRVAFWSKRPLAFNRTHIPLARWIAYHLGLGAFRGDPATVTHRIDDERAPLCDADGQRGIERVTAGAHLRTIGESVEWQAVLHQATQVAPTQATVLITGESGTGKEVLARFIHAASARRSAPFVALNCAALPEQLLESELFGHERGAFTSAHQAKPGQVELASGGVLFLDEVSEMSLSAQAKFLRVLQEREFQRLGGTRLLKANIRVIAATNRDLRKAVERGDFREDLFYRLGVFDIRIPALRDRSSDILPLSEAFLHEIGRGLGRPPAGLTREARRALLDYDWPGNVRELRNVLERAAILCEGALIDTTHLTLESRARAIRNDTTDLGVVERTTIVKVLKECRGNKTRAAQRLGLSRTQLHLRIRKYRLEEAASA